MHGSNVLRSSSSFDDDPLFIDVVNGQCLQYKVNGIEYEDGADSDALICPICIFSLLSHAGQKCIVVYSSMLKVVCSTLRTKIISTYMRVFLIFK